MKACCLGVLLVGVVCLSACQADDDPAQADGGPDDGGNLADALVDCGPQTPDLTPNWLRPFQEEVVAKLAGAQEIAPSTTLADRATPIRRGQAQVYLEQELAAMGYPVQTDEYGNGTNVFVELEGSGEGLYVLGAHYDSVADSPGANDNATGVAAVLAAARFLREQDCRVHDVVFVLFDQEEIGLIGSKAFAQKLQFDGEDVRGVYTLDQLGWDLDQDRRLEVELPGPGMLAQVQSSISRHGLGVGITETATDSSDHEAFRNAGFPALGITEEYVSGDTTPHYHLPGDTFATVDFAFLESASAVLNGLFFDLSTNI
jgi:acetylornithine deacetylase/succinyl-diaminopimelate desuccinylase-like protein